ncbi:polygalacturonase inhibitor [Cajanus cajan]|uniref:polygalacturonase inhibitor n=1 Tax=Cajanus cajan TaxID=3821 RepID=UPI00098D8B07|nr:polygalacturonase inhibitor [Cajanus cajan]
MTTKLFILFIFLSYTIPSLSKRYCNPEDKRVLLQIKKEFNNPTLLSSWKPNTDCCHDKWHGTQCNHNTNRIESLKLSYNNHLASQIPPSIGSLPYLETLFLFHLPNLTGPIPRPISKLTHLKYLTISATNISGPIPNFLAQLKSLINLDLTFNNLSGPLPSSLYQLPNLTGIFLGYNKLTGPIPYSYGFFNDKNYNNPNLYLSHNKLSGRIPMSLGRLNFSSISLSHNKFEGDASMLFGPTKVTAGIDISWNKFEFDFGKVELPKVTTSLALDVSHNQIYGNLPVGIENVFMLNVSYNKLCGEIPKGDNGNSHDHDVYSYIHNKCLCGSPLPSCK